MAETPHLPRHLYYTFFSSLISLAGSNVNPYEADLTTRLAWSHCTHCPPLHVSCRRVHARTPNADGLPSAGRLVQPPLPPGQSPGVVESKQEGEPEGSSSSSSGGDEGKTYLRPTPMGPMVAVYLDDKSVSTLQSLYPDTREARLRKVVLQYGPSDEERDVYEPLFGGIATVKVCWHTRSA